MAEPTTRREQMKADRRRQLLIEAARLIAERGFLGVRLEDLGSAAGISGPAVYRHFPNKDAVLVELLVGISTRLLDGGTAVADTAESPAAALSGLVDFHLDFALTEPDLIRIQDRDLENLPPEAKRQVRLTQRRYVEVWVGVLLRVSPGTDEESARVMAHATFGLLNSTPHSADPSSPELTRSVLRAMAFGALTTLR
ncbi:TetR/AcrR family transcriptional regulator [Rhodococcus triatomae]|uniref:DNA-binding transcriptional regulator, AcrR family n=1 Tax=Rhodococcus triatomae TaxID=300028 RepID=A0A1G8JML8_9NOCA|nr:TetR/AcrR family transcriptional regulator [Rhodococcus triatomae]QNG19680.1 TetR/AcrR family transcriptional regulator [Rhodococcus triatomae]QNG24405.1 TetR/AcrR family transcriptional regulator [Rhodococcus triatomae]SDI32539.1 DNA-binding transcriptional regulator, AcrR family [Rhodococcus triatomae]